MTTLTMEEEKRLEIIHKMFRAKLTVVRAAMVLGVTSRRLFIMKTPRCRARAKVRERLAWDHATVAVATVVQSSGGVVREARVVMGGVAPVPWRAPKAEEFLRGKKLDEATAQKAGEIALEGAKPLKDNGYKVKMAQDLIQRGLLASV